VKCKKKLNKKLRLCDGDAEQQKMLGEAQSLKRCSGGCIVSMLRKDGRIVDLGQKAMPPNRVSGKRVPVRVVVCLGEICSIWAGMI